MPSLTSPLRRVGRLLVGHVRRLRLALEVLAAQVRAAVARAIGQATGNAVRDAVSVILEGPPADPSPGRDPLDEAKGLWGEPRRPRWPGQPYESYDPDDVGQHHAEQESGRYDDELAAPEPSAQARTSVWTRAVAVGCQAAGWWLRKHPGRCSVVAAVGVGLAAGVTALFGGPLVGGASAATASILGVLALADAARAAATFAGAAVT